MIRIYVPTIPRGQERAGRVVRIDGSGRPRVLAYTPHKTRLAVNEIRNEWIRLGRQKVPDDKPFTIRVNATMLRPDSHTRRDGSATRNYRDVPRRPDVDNILKLVLDALQPDCFKDDSACQMATVCKQYGDHNALEILIEWA
jgi:Holliday junction resolvase RusA-like endonuclease